MSSLMNKVLGIVAEHHFFIADTIAFYLTTGI